MITTPATRLCYSLIGKNLFLKQLGYQIVHFLFAAGLNKLPCEPPPLIDYENSRYSRNIPERIQINDRLHEEKPVEFALDEELQQQILKGKRLRRLQNISIKLDPAQILALKKLATMKSIPYQTLIRQWLAERIRKELHMASK